MERIRELYFYKGYFKEFFGRQSIKVQKKILWTLQIIESMERIPGIYFKHIENTDGLYEIRVQLGNNIFRIFCFFDDNDLIVIANGFQKKTQKTLVSEIEKALNLRKEYYEEKKSHQP